MAKLIVDNSYQARSYHVLYTRKISLPLHFKFSVKLTKSLNRISETNSNIDKVNVGNIYSNSKMFHHISRKIRHVDFNRNKTDLEN